MAGEIVYENGRCHVEYIGELSGYWVWEPSSSKGLMIAREDFPPTIDGERKAIQACDRRAERWS